MFRTACLILALSLTPSLPASATADAANAPMKTFAVPAPGAPMAVADRIMAETGGALARADSAGATILSYAGLTPPAELRDYLARTLPNLDPRVVAQGAPLTLAIALAPDGAGTEIRFMIRSPQFETPGALALALGDGLPEGASILMNDGATGGCAGQVVLSHDGPASTAAQPYLDRLEAQGFEIIEDDTQDTSFFVGHRSDCDLFLYVQPDPTGANRSTVILKYLEA